MDTIEKLKVLSEDSQYDLACACGTRDDDRRRRGRDGKWLYPVALPQGGYSVLLKTLLSNACANDCKYCPLRSQTNVQRCTLQPEEIARVFMEYVMRKKVFGLFLSSAVVRNADYTMDRINAVARLLRYKHNFKGYIHLKIIPGASDAAIEDSLKLASGVSLNIETPGKKHFDVLSDKKDYMNDIIRPIKLMGKLTEKGGKFSRVKCTTQFIVGASDEKDSEIINYLFGLYNRLNFKRVYFSAYQKGLGHPDIPGEKQLIKDPDVTFMREHRLYQASFLLRDYGFNLEDLSFTQEGNLPLPTDPKLAWAQANLSANPLEINRAEKTELLRVPGIGPKGAEAILRARRQGKLRDLSSLQKLGVIAERAAPYVLLDGRSAPAQMKLF